MRDFLRNLPIWLIAEAVNSPVQSSNFQSAPCVALCNQVKTWWFDCVSSIVSHYHAGGKCDCVYCQRRACQDVFNHVFVRDHILYRTSVSATLRSLIVWTMGNTGRSEWPSRDQPLSVHCFIKRSFSCFFFSPAGAFRIINPEEKELCFGGMLHWQGIVGGCGSEWGGALVGSGERPVKAVEGDWRWRDRGELSCCDGCHAGKWNAWPFCEHTFTHRHNWLFFFAWSALSLIIKPEIFLFLKPNSFQSDWISNILNIRFYIKHIDCQAAI